MIFFDILEHPSDLFVRVHGKSHRELIVNCIRTFGHLVVDDVPDNVTETRTIKLRGDQIENVVVDLFSELIAAIDSENLLITTAGEITGGIPGSMTVNVSGVLLRGDEAYSNVIKAVTYHDLKYYREEGFITVLFDL